MAGNLIWHGWSWKNQSRWFGIDRGINCIVLSQSKSVKWCPMQEGSLLLQLPFGSFPWYSERSWQPINMPSTNQRGTFSQGFADHTNPSSIHLSIHFTVQYSIVCIYIYRHMDIHMIVNVYVHQVSSYNIYIYIYVYIIFIMDMT